VETWEELVPLVPAEVAGALLGWEWEPRLLWALAVPAESIPFKELEPVLSLPMWRSEDGTPFAVRPYEVLAQPDRYPGQFDRVLTADLVYPLDVTWWNARWIVLDGLHRLAKAARLALAVVPVRKIPRALYPAFAATQRVKRPVRRSGDGRACATRR
jgi:hypothetical protein